MRSLKICALTALCTAPLAAQAAKPALDDMDDRIARAEAVIEGTIESVRFVESQPDAAGGAGIPHMFVTYRVERVFKGRIAGPTVTLRFFGGLDSTGDELLINSDGIRPDAGDRDIVMLAGNGRAECPVIDCTEGRYRLIDGSAYDDFGRDVVLDAAGGAVRRGTMRDLDGIHDWAATGLGRVFDGDPLPPADPRATLSADAFRGLIADRARLLGDQAAPPVALVSVDPDAPFVYRQSPAVAPAEPDGAGVAPQ